MFASSYISLSFSSYPGVQILERTTVQQVLVEKGQVTAVETDRGSIECEYFVNCAGQVNLGVGYKSGSISNISANLDRWINEGNPL